ncbi:unnamed protein product [Prorocentrum cordatum]|uniref:Ion transport domain-containing protein n=1 Tax=Prorocentrum cordatum TaxID=2364126 RepID=A0ABN9PHZ0_9DINO|nr:unnamed protein product [Polarella glacialis]
MREVGEELRLELRIGLAGLQERPAAPPAAPRRPPCRRHAGGGPRRRAGGGGGGPAPPGRAAGCAAVGSLPARPEERCAFKAAAERPLGDSSVLLKDKQQTICMDSPHPESPAVPRLHMVARNIHAMHGIGRESMVELRRDATGIARCRALARSLTHGHQTAFDVVIGLVILVNSAFIGLEIDLSLAVLDDPSVTDAVPGYFSLVESLFLFIYLFELCVRFAADGKDVFRSGWFAFDLTLVCIGAVSHWILTPTMGKGGAGVTDQILLARNLRLVRLVRAVRMMESSSTTSGS